MQQPRTRHAASPRILPAALALALAACHDGGGGSSAPPAQATFAASIAASQVSGVAGTSFHLEAQLFGAAPATAEYAWDLGDGSAAAGPAADVAYAAPGSYAVTLTVTDTEDGEQGGDQILLVVFDPFAPQGLFGEPLPSLPGDLDGDGTLALRDAQILRQHLAGLVPILDGAQAARADFDLDGAITEQDSALLAEAVLLEADVPRKVVPASGPPGRVVTIFSPALLDPAAAILVQIGLAEPIQPPRLVLGQVSVFVPLDVLTPGAFTEAGGAAQVRLLANGVEVESFAFEVEAPPPLPADPLAGVEQLLAGASGVRVQALAHIEAFLATPTALELGFTPDSATVLAALFETATAELAQHEAEHLAMLASLDALAAEAMARFARANGLDAALAALAEAQAAQAATAAFATASDLDLLCKAAVFADLVSTVDSGTGYLCAALLAAAFGALALPEPFLDAPALFAAATACAKYYALLELPGLVLEFLPKTGKQLLLEADPSGPLEPGESTSITPSIEVLGLTNLCSVADQQGSGKLLEFLAKKLTYKLLKKAPFSQLLAAAKAISEATTKKIVDLVQGVVSTVIGATGLPDYLQDLALALCAKYQILGSKLPVDTAIVGVTLVPDAGSVSKPGGASPIVYTCPDDPGAVPDGGVKLTAELALCTGKVKASVTIHCAELVDVVITMGDNGPATDDIYEVVVDGTSVLTSSVPVVSTSTTIQLTTGDHVLQMKGLAAPDGIGTYFISVQGGTLTGGPPLSGTNLTAGTVFTWTLVVG